MMELGTGTPSADLIKDSSEATFMQDVVETSKETPVIVDFWAPWCGPCKTLGPALEAAVNEAGGKVKMVKVNVDENQMLAGQMRVQSIPAVFAFVDGQPVDGFMGAQPASEIKTFVTKIADMNKEDGGLEEAIKMADEMLEQGEAVDAAQTYAAILGEQPETAAAYAGLIRANIAMGAMEQAKGLIENVSETLAKDPAFQAVKAQMELAEQAAEAGDTSELRIRLDANPDDHQTRFDLALALLGADNTQGAVDELLELFRRDRDWNEDAARQQLFKIFDSLGPQDPVAQAGRRKLSSIIFS